MTTMRQSTKFHVVDVPVALPGHCFICRAHDREFFLDTGMNLERDDGQPFEGALYICSECLAEMAHAVGYIKPKAAEGLKQTNERLADSVYELEVRNGKLEHVVAGLTDLVGADRSSSILSILVEPERQEPEASDPAATESDSGPAESDSEQGLGNLFSLDSPKPKPKS